MRKHFHIRNSELLAVLLQLAVCVTGTANAETSTQSVLTALPSNECESTLGSCYTTTSVTAMANSSDAGTSTSLAYAPVATGSSGIASGWLYIGARTSPGKAPGAIDVWGICRYVNNNNAMGGDSYFMPFNTLPEWQAFFLNATTNTNGAITFNTCARPTTFTVPSFYTSGSGAVTGDPTCGVTLPVSLPYDPTGTVLTYNGSFSCTDDGGWTEGVTVSFTA